MRCTPFFKRSLGTFSLDLTVDGNSAVQALVARVLADPSCQAALAEPTLASGQTATLWREQSFEVLLDDHWTSGIIDRATVILR